MKIPFYLCLFFTLVLVLNMSSFALLPSNSSKKAEVSIDQLSSGEVTIIGKLGIAVGQPATIRVRPIALDESAKNSIKYLEGPAIDILQINDRVLDTPIQYAARKRLF